MDQANPYQAPEPVLPTATEVASLNQSGRERHDDVVCGLKSLKISAWLYLLATIIVGFWDFCNFYCYLIDDPLQNHSDFYTYWLIFSLHVVGECFCLAGLYYCSTRSIDGVSRAPLLIALILGAVIFPDQFYKFALEKPWIYFEGYGNTHASYIMQYMSYFMWMALNIWLVLWTAVLHDSRNQKRVLQMLFLDTLNFILNILGHSMSMLVFADKPAVENGSYAIYYLLGGCGDVALLISNILAIKVYSSLIAQLSESSVPEKQSPVVLSD